MNQTPEELSRKIEDARAKDRAPAPSGEPGDAAAASSGWRAAIDLVAGGGVGGFMGYWLDRWLGWAPWGMLALLFLGFGAGLANIYRAETGQDFSVGYKRKPEDEGK
jgi:ATP synthase protein I